MKSFSLSVALACTLALLILSGRAASPAPEQAAAGPRTAPAQASAEKLPNDVYSDSRNRLPLVKREELDDLGKKLYDDVLRDSRSLVGLQGPTGIRMHSPPVSEYMTTGNQYLRYNAGIEPRLAELAILVAARAMDSQFEWAAHEPAGLRAGLEQAILDTVKHRLPLTGLGEKEAAIIQLGREALGEHKVRSETFARALELFGRQGLVNVVSLMSHYTATATLLTIFDQQLPPGQKPLLPLP